MKAQILILLGGIGFWGVVHGQTAADDFYILSGGTALSVPAPGVLANDAGGNLTALLNNGPANGVLNFNANGSFVYAVTNDFKGLDAFTYQNTDGNNTSSVATVNLMVTPPGRLFYDDFMRPAASNSLFPWVAASGAWALTKDMLSGTCNLDDYGCAYYQDANWTNYSVQARIRYSTSNAWGGAIGGRLNPETGARYCVWVYPENSPYTSPGGTASLQLIKYGTWTDYTAQHLVPLPAVGTNWHTVRLEFQGNTVSAFFDGTLAATLTDDGAFDGRPAFVSGGIEAELYAQSPLAYTMLVDDVNVSVVTAANNDLYVSPENATLQVPAPGVLTNDQGSGALTAFLTADPAFGTLTLTNNGGFSYTPSNDFTGVDLFTYQATDGQTTSAVATAAIAVAPPGCLFMDNFVRPTNNNIIFPWVVKAASKSNASGIWTITNQTFQGASTSFYTYTLAYLDRPDWTNYSLQAQVSVPSTSAVGTGLGGRINPRTGARYCVWMKPENAPDGPWYGTASVVLYKYSDWTTFVDNEILVGAVGTNQHALKVTFQGNHNLAYFDGNLVTNWVDDGSIDGRPAYINGGVDVEAYAFTTAYTSSVSNLVVETTKSLILSSNDAYTNTVNTTLQVSAPGVLANDFSADGPPLTAILVNGPAFGTLAPTNNGGFSYTPSTNFAGMDTFSYQATDGQTTSGVATVQIMVLPPGYLFYDGFTRPASDGSLFPWTSQLGDWSVTNHVLLGTCGLDDYGYAYHQNATWTNYAVKATIRYPSSNVWGGAVGGRLDPVSGARYTAWVYPENSPWGPLNGLPAGTPAMQIIKYEDWINYTTKPLVPLPAVDTNWHDVKLAFQGNQVAAYFDDNLIASLTDDGSLDGWPAYTSGGISLDMYAQAPTAYTLMVSNVEVIPLVFDPSYRTGENTVLHVGAPGVLNGDTDVYGTNLVAMLISGPANGMLDLDANGGFAYTPNANFTGRDAFTFRAMDDSNIVGTATVTVTVEAGMTLLPPIINSITANNGMVAIRWNSLTGATYRVQYTDRLDAGDWMDLPPDLTATASTTTQTNVPGSPSQRFYRIILLRP